MKFVAPEQVPEQAEVIKNTPFWPDVDLSEFRSVMRTDGTVTQPRLKQVVLTAISEVNAELYDFRNRQQLLGYRHWLRFRRICWTAKASVSGTTTTPFFAGRVLCSMSVIRTMTPRRQA